MAGGCNGAHSVDGCDSTHSAAKRSYPMSEVRGSGQECQAATAQEQPRGATHRLRPGSGWEEQPHGKEQQLCFAVTAVKRYPTSKVRETQVRR